MLFRAFGIALFVALSGAVCAGAAKFNISEVDAALISAAEDGNLTEVQRLGGLGASVNVKDDTGTTPLGWAAFNGHEDVVLYLLAEGALVNAADYQGFTPLDSAAENGFVRIARILVEHGAPVDTRNQEGRTPLYAATSEGHLSVVRLLVSAGADIDARFPPTDGTPLLVASELGFPRIVRYLIAREADIAIIDRFGSFPLYLASQNGHAEVVGDLLDRGGVDPDQLGPDATVSIVIAAQNGHVEVVRALLEGGADPNIANDFGDTALHKAPTVVDSPELIELLVAAGANIDAADNRDDTPLHMAAQFGSKEAVQLLLESRADRTLPNASFLLPEEVICQCLEFIDFPDSLQCPEGSCTEDDIDEIEGLLKGSFVRRSTVEQEAEAPQSSA